ncbi:MAG: CHAD domain-containing protein [Anaerolineae bacterium]
MSSMHRPDLQERRADPDAPHPRRPPAADPRARRPRGARRWQFVDTFDGRIHRAGGALAVVARAGRRPAASGAADGSDGGTGPWLVWQARRPPRRRRAVAGAAARLRPRRRRARTGRWTRWPRSSRRGSSCRWRASRPASPASTSSTARARRSPGCAYAGDDDGRRARAHAPWLELGAVRGYDDALAVAAAACERMIDAGLLADGSPGLAARTLAALGRKAGGVSTKFDVPLEADQPAARAAAAIFKALHKTIRATLPGTKADLDPEFLHDFRVAVRRTRAGLTLLRDALPGPMLDHFKAEFGWLGAATGPTRDLDVYLDGMPGYRAALPPEVAADLGPLEGYLRTRQAAAHADLVAALESPRFAALLADWKAALKTLKGAVPGADDPAAAEPTAEEPADGVAAIAGPGAEAAGGATDMAGGAAGTSGGAIGPAAATPIAALAARQIWRRYKRVLADGRAIGPDSPVTALHALRIEAKKLRYALEFFRRLVPAESADALIGSLKGLQDNLGTLNDMGVQQGAMRAFAADLGRRPTNSATLLAMGWLTAEMHARELACRREFDARFGAFDAKDNRRRYERLFHGVDGRGAAARGEAASDVAAGGDRTGGDAAGVDAASNGGGR